MDRDCLRATFDQMHDHNYPLGIRSQGLADEIMERYNAQKDRADKAEKLSAEAAAFLVAYEHGAEKDRARIKELEEGQVQLQQVKDALAKHPIDEPRMPIMSTSVDVIGEYFGKLKAWGHEGWAARAILEEAIRTHRKEREADDEWSWDYDIELWATVDNTKKEIE